MNTDQHLDDDILQTLQELMGDGFPMLITTFIDDSSERIHDLQNAVASKDSDAVRRAAHSFKGSCQNLGATALADLCERMEQRSLEGELDGLASCLVDIQQEFNQVKSLLNRFAT